MPQEHDPRPFHLDHIRPQKHGGPTVLENLSLSCAACSLFKGPNAAGYDPETDELFLSLQSTLAEMGRAFSVEWRGIEGADTNWQNHN